MALKIVALGLTLLVCLCQFHKIGAVSGIDNSARLLGCILNSDGAYSDWKNSMQGGYGCFCRMNPPVEDLSKDPIDDVDRVCKTYFNCLKTMLEVVNGQCYNQGTILTIPNREYDPYNAASCALVGSSACDHDNDCAVAVCNACDKFKVNDLKAALAANQPRADKTCPTGAK